MKIFNSGLFALLLCFAGAAHADLLMNRSIVEQGHDVGKSDIVVFNNDPAANLFVEVQPFEVLNPGAADQQLVKLEITDDPAFLVTPNRLIVEPQSRSLVRLLNLNKSGARERIYRVNIVPVTPPPELDLQSEDGVQPQLQIVVAYQVLVIILPENPQPEPAYERQPGKVIFTNAGNANYLLTDGFQCNPADAEDCVDLQDHRVYAGNTWELELPFSGPFTYKIETSRGSLVRVFE